MPSQTTMTTIPPVDLAQQYRQIQSEADAAVLEILHSGAYIGGAVVQAFEREFAAYHGNTTAIACNSGTDALYLALRALDIGPGDEVIAPTFTFIATTEVISSLGATPVFVDVAAGGFNLDLAQVEAAITPKTKGIIPVHLFGQPVDMDHLMAIAKRHGLFVIEDCAQATGASWGDRKVGTFGDFGCFSFFPTKNLGGCGDGGAVITQNAALAEKVTMLREHGSRVRYCHEEIGVNSRLDAVQAAILRVKLTHLDRWNQQRQAIAHHYHQQLNNLPLTLPQELPGGQSCWNQFTVRIPNHSPNPEATSRDRLRETLKTQGIIAMVYYPCPLHRQPVYDPLNYGPGSLPRSEAASQEVLSLPMFPDLSPEQQRQVTQAIATGLQD